MVYIERTFLPNDNEQHIGRLFIKVPLSVYHSGGIFMPKNKVQDAVFTAIMAIIMVYGMIVMSR